MRWFWQGKGHNVRGPGPRGRGTYEEGGGQVKGGGCGGEDGGLVGVCGGGGGWEEHELINRGIDTSEWHATCVCLTSWEGGFACGAARGVVHMESGVHGLVLYVKCVGRCGCMDQPSTLR